MTMTVPNDPFLFFSEFFAHQFDEDKRFPRADMHGAAVFQVFDEGVWNFRVKNATLAVSEGMPEDTVLQIGVTRETFQTLFVTRTQQEINKKGAPSEGSKSVFLPLFFNEAKRRIALGSHETLRMRVRFEGEQHEVLLTPGHGAPTAPRATVSLGLEDFMAMAAGKKKAPFLFLRGKLKVAGDIKYALRMNQLLG